MSLSVWPVLSALLLSVASAADVSALKIIREKCTRCHTGEQAPNRLRLDSVDSMIRGGKRGPAVVPYKPDESLIYRAIVGDGLVRMPPYDTLEESEVAAIRRWIYRGAMQYSMSSQEP